MNSKKNQNAIRRYSNTSCNSNNVVTNPINLGYCNPFKLFTNSLSYYKTKWQHEHVDHANEPYKIRFNKAKTSAYIVWSNVNDVEVSDVELNTIERVVLMALDTMSERAIKLTCQSVRSFITNEIPNFYFNGIDLPLLIKWYKKQHEMKHRTDRDCLVFRPKKPTISKGAKRLGRVVK